MSSWQYSSDLGEERVRRLLDEVEFSAISEMVVGNMEILCWHLEVCGDNSNFARAIFNVKVPPLVFDLFFNSPSGYRGAYFQSPQAGLLANKAFIRRLQPLLLNWGVIEDGGFDKDFAKQSLESESSKVWLAECGNQICEKCVGEWSNPTDTKGAEILNGRWGCGDSERSRRGGRAPVFSKLRIIGAFINPEGDEYVAERKSSRALDIHIDGWT